MTFDYGQVFVFKGGLCYLFEFPSFLFPFTTENAGAVLTSHCV